MSKSLDATKWITIAFLALATHFVGRPPVVHADDKTQLAVPPSVDASALLNQLWDTDADVRLAAGKTLLDHADALTADADEIAESVALCDPLDDNDLRRFGRRALLRMGRAAMPAAIAHLSDDDQLIAALAEPLDAASVDPLIGLIAANKALSRDADGWSDQWGVKQALLTIGPAAVAGPLTKALDKNRDSLPLLVAVHDLAGPEFADAVPVLIELLAEESEARCMLAAAALVHIGDAALPSLRAALKNRSQRAAALYAIDQLAVQATSLADPLFDLATSDETITNEFVLAKYGCLPGEMTVGELARRVLRSIHPPADRYLTLEHAERLPSQLAIGYYPFALHDLRPDGKQLADHLALALSLEATATRIDKLCARATYDAGGDKRKEHNARRSALADERFFRTKMTAVWNRVAPDDPRLVEAVLRLIESADYREFPPTYDDGCGGLSWIDLLFLREAVQQRSQSYLPRLREMLAGDDVDRTKALYFFAHLGPHAREAVDTAFASLASESVDARMASLLVLAEHAPPSVRLADALLDRFANDEDDEVRHAAFHALAPHAALAVAGVPTLANIVGATEREEDEGTRSYRFRQRAAELLALIGPPAKAAVPALVQATTTNIRALRYAPIVALGQIAAEPRTSLAALRGAYVEAAATRDQEYLYISSALFAETCPPQEAVCLRSIGRFGAAAKDEQKLLLAAALERVEPDAKFERRQPSIEAAIALARIGPSARPVLPQLRAAILRGASCRDDRARQVALAIAVIRIDERPQPSDVAALVEALRFAEPRDMTSSITEELTLLSQKHAEIAPRLRVLMLREQRLHVSPPSETRRENRASPCNAQLDRFARCLQAIDPNDATHRRLIEQLLATELKRTDDAAWRIAPWLKLRADLGHASPEFRAALDAAASHENASVRILATAVRERLDAL